MRQVITLTSLLAVVASCAGAQADFPSVQPTLVAIETLGFRCGDGVADNAPSGLYQWHCTGTVDGVASTVLVDGNHEGVVGITLAIDESTDPNIARQGFRDLVNGVPPLNTAPILGDTLTGWTGDDRRKAVGGVGVSAVCDATQCIVMVGTTGDPLRPLPLP